MDGERVWELMEARGTRIMWLHKQTGIALQRLYHLKYAASPRGPYLWRPQEMEAVARVLGRSERALFGKNQTVRGICVACGKRARVAQAAQSTTQGQTQQSTASPGS